MEQNPNNTYQGSALLEQYFSHQKAMLYQDIKFRFFHCFENLQQYKLVTLVEGNLKAPFSITTRQRCR